MRLLAYRADDLAPRDARARAWASITPLSLVIVVGFFSFFLYGLADQMELPHLVDNGFLQIHGVGHAIFRVFGLTAAVAGGTFLQLFVPFALGCFFIRKRQPIGVALCMFFFFEQFLPVARYMADAQVQQLPLYSVGRYDSVIHDWNYLFSSLRVLSYDVVVANAVRFIGYLGMISTPFWLLWRGVYDTFNS